MATIRYLCLSDVHLGEEDSLLTHIRPETGALDLTGPSPVTERLPACLAALLRDGPKPTLILGGDLLEFALAPSEHALMVFEHFLRAFMPAGGELFREIIVLPGNHDHHLWEAARETQYLQYLERTGDSSELEKPWSTTKIFMDMDGEDRLASGLLTTTARRVPHLAGREVLVAYPNFGLVRDNRCVVFHHGHFIEPAYHLMSTVMSMAFPDRPAPATVYDLEHENAAWIDFFWSALGSCGDIGPRVESVYEATGDEAALRRIADNVAGSVAERYDFPFGGPAWGRRLLLQPLFRKIASRAAGTQERQQRDRIRGVPLSNEAMAGLTTYLEQFLCLQIEQEHGPVPARTTFVFGHSHKPFERVMEFRGYPAPVPVFNTGGWVVDTVEADGSLGGAAVLIDDDLNAVSLRFYNEDAYEAQVNEPRLPDEPHTELYMEVKARLQADVVPWRELGTAIKAELQLREKWLARRLQPAPVT